MVTAVERETRIRELHAELEVLRNSTTKEAGVRVARIIRELVDMQRRDTLPQ